MAPSDTFLNALYAAPTTPALWGDVLDACIATVGAESGWVCELDRRDRFAGSGFIRNMESGTQDRYFAHYAGLDPFRHDAAGAPDPGLGLWSDERFIRKGDLVRSEFYADFMTPIRVHSILIVRMFDDGHVTRSMHLNYGKRTGRTTATGRRELEGAFAHLKRAAALSHEVGRLSACGAALGSALEASAGCAMLLDRAARIRFATEAAEALLRRSDGLSYQQGRLRASRLADEAGLQRLVTLAVGGAGRRRTGGSLQIDVAGRAMLFTITPLGLVTSSGDDPVAMVTLRDRDLSGPPLNRLLDKRFGLTSAERRIALMLAAGSSPRQIAETRDISYNTVRNHLKKIYDKCGVRRQGELAACIHRLVLSAGSE